MNNLEKNQNCGKEQCGCKSTSQSQLKTPQPKPIQEKNNPEEILKDPTRFGDWEVNGRAIDF